MIADSQHAKVLRAFSATLGVPESAHVRLAGFAGEDAPETRFFVCTVFVPEDQAHGRRYIVCTLPVADSILCTVAADNIERAVASLASLRASLADLKSSALAERHIIEHPCEALAEGGWAGFGVLSEEFVSGFPGAGARFKESTGLRLLFLIPLTRSELGLVRKRGWVALMDAMISGHRDAAAWTAEAWESDV